MSDTHIHIQHYWRTKIDSPPCIDHEHSDRIMARIRCRSDAPPECIEKKRRCVCWQRRAWGVSSHFRQYLYISERRTLVRVMTRVPLASESLQIGGNMRKEQAKGGKLDLSECPPDAMNAPPLLSIASPLCSGTRQQYLTFIAFDRHQNRITEPVSYWEIMQIC